MLKEWPIATHWEGCEEEHPECKIVKLNRRIAELERQLKNNGWISTAERLPEIGEPVLLMISECYVSIGYRESDERWVACIGCYGSFLSVMDDFRWLPDPYCQPINGWLVSYWSKVPLPPKDVIQLVIKNSVRPPKAEELRRIRDKYIQEGGKMLSPEELDEEIQSRR